MASKEELIKGLELLIQEGERLANSLTAAELEKVVDVDGWKGKEMFAHVAGIGAMVAPMVTGIANAAPGSDAIGGVDIDQLNAGIVSQRAGKSAQDLADELATNYRAVIEFVRNAPDDLLNKKATARGYKDVAVSDLVNRMVVLHGLAHIYSVYSSVFWAV
ncbi:MAG TPA: maleylpyruvate isomerase N-terminal domain-containing protein [Dehalococcoidia bacterium]|nr:maleylpyruvate isomerase N-terminal domain-containing protein [Dehalococcoidia bacterium]